jgi:uncharacterized protein with beta-barrel porin domain
MAVLGSLTTTTTTTPGATFGQTKSVHFTYRPKSKLTKLLMGDVTTEGRQKVPPGLVVTSPVSATPCENTQVVSEDLWGPRRRRR